MIRIQLREQSGALLDETFGHTLSQALYQIGKALTEGPLGPLPLAHLIEKRHYPQTLTLTIEEQLI